MVPSFSWYGSRRFLLRKKIRKSSPINMIPARLPVMPPAIAAAFCELPGALTSREPCPLPPVPPFASVDEAAADVEVVDVVSRVADVDDLGEISESDWTLCVLVSNTTVLTVVVECVVILAVVVVESVVG